MFFEHGKKSRISHKRPHLAQPFLSFLLFLGDLEGSGWGEVAKRATPPQPNHLYWFVFHLPLSPLPLTCVFQGPSFFWGRGGRFPCSVLCYKAHLPAACSKRHVLDIPYMINKSQTSPKLGGWGRFALHFKATRERNSHSASKRKKETSPQSRFSKLDASFLHTIEVFLLTARKTKPNLLQATKTNREQTIPNRE